MQAARSSLQRKKTPGVFEAEDYISIKHLTRPQTLPRLYDGEMLKRAGSQPHMHLPIASPSKAYTSLSSQHMNSVRTVPDYLDKSLNTYRSASMTGRKPTVEYLQTYDARSLSLPIEADQEWSPADMKSIEAAKAKNKEIQSKSQETRVTPTQTLLANKPEFTLLSEILVAFESVANTFTECPWFLAAGRLPALSNLHYLQEKFLTLAKGLTKWHLQVSVDTKLLEDRAKKLEEAQLQVKILTSKNEEITDKFEGMRRKKKDQATYFEKNDRDWQSERARLENHVMLLSDQLAKLQGEGSMDAMAARLTDQQQFMSKLGKEFNMYKDVEKAKKLKLVQELATIKEQMKAKQEAFARFEKEKEEFESRLSAKNDEIVEWQCRVQEQVESSLMLAEETRRYIDYKEKYDRLFVLNEELKRTYTKLENGVKSGNVGAFGGEMIVPLDDPLFKKVTERATPEQNNRRLSSSAKVKKTEIDSDIPIDLTKYAYLRPNFAAFIEDSMPEGHQSLFEPPFGNWLEATIRGIFDSKYYEHLMCSEEMGRKPTRFPDFVYAWTGHFMIDENTRQVKNLERWQKERSDKWRLMLLLGVKHEMAKRVWEISTFKEFLMEELGVDELAFYLHCRFLLFDGPQLGITLGRFKHLHYVLLKKAKDVVDLVMSKLPEKLLGDVRSLLSEHARRKDSELQIESSLVLRVMLEYYRKEKQVKYRAIKQLFETCRANSTTTDITFFSFRSIVDNLKWDLTECQVAGFFRDCWTAGCGVIDPDTFFLVANESTYFLKSLRLKGTCTEPPLGADNLIARQESPAAELMSSIYETWQSTASCFSILKEGLTLMGQPEIAHFVLKFDNYIKKKGQLPPEEYSGWSISETFKHLWVMILRLDLAFQEHNSLCKPIVYTAEDFSNATSGTL